MEFSPKCRVMKLGMLFTILGRFCLFIYWEVANIWPLPSKNGVAKIWIDNLLDMPQCYKE